MNRLLAPEKLQEIQRNANTVLKSYAHILDPLERLLKIATDNGITILEADLYEMSGLLRKDGNRWLLYVNKGDSRQRQLFTIAHELGHYFVHKEACDMFVDGQFISRSEDEKYETLEVEANEFAAGLLMPESEIRWYIGKNPLTVSMVFLLARKFRVSASAMETRLRNLAYDVPEYQPTTA